MQKLSFSNKSVAEAFQDFAKVKGSIEETGGEVVLSYNYDTPEKASYDEVDEKMANAMDYMYRSMDRQCEYMNERIDRLARAFYEHTDKHLPNPQTPSQMQKAVTALGMGEDYEVKKRTIYATHGDKTLEMSY
jgi:hypothetical protein